MKHLTRGLSAAVLAALLSWGVPAARAVEPIKIGFSMELTGPFAVVGKTGLLAFKIWEEEVNAEGGLLGRPVKLVYYDDQSNPSLVPGIYTKLIDIDKVDLLISSYGTNLVVPAIPVAISRNRLFFGLFALAANDKFHYPRYFSMLLFGPEPVKTFAEGWFDLAAAQNPKPKTVAIVATDAEFQHKAAESAREHSKAKGIGIVYDRAYPPTTIDFSPIVRAVQATQPELVYIASYRPTRSASCVRSGRLALTQRCSAAALPDCRRQRSRCSSAKWPTASSMSICGSRSRQCNFLAS
jgi:branched-chain amino acid transport system substrate-binding protein